MVEPHTSLSIADVIGRVLAVVEDLHIGRITSPRRHPRPQIGLNGCRVGLPLQDALARGDPGRAEPPRELEGVDLVAEPERLPRLEPGRLSLPRLRGMPRREPQVQIEILPQRFQGGDRVGQPWVERCPTPVGLVDQPKANEGGRQRADFNSKTRKYAPRYVFRLPGASRLTSRSVMLQLNATLAKVATSRRINLPKMKLQASVALLTK